MKQFIKDKYIYIIFVIAALIIGFSLYSIKLNSPADNNKYYENNNSKENTTDNTQNSNNLETNTNNQSNQSNEDNKNKSNTNNTKESSKTKKESSKTKKESTKETKESKKTDTKTTDTKEQPPKVIGIRYLSYYALTPNYTFNIPIEVTMQKSDGTTYRGDKSSCNLESTDYSIVSISGKNIQTNSNTPEYPIVVKINCGGITGETRIRVTSLIHDKNKKGYLSSPSIYDYANKQVIGCGSASLSNRQKEMLTEILNSKVNAVGYGTRASIVEAARFLAINFPYRISYAYGDWDYNNVVNNEERKRAFISPYTIPNHQIFGKYFSRGLNPQWGCTTIKQDQNNCKNGVCGYKQNSSYADGLDCTGFIYWAFVNGGYVPTRANERAYDINSLYFLKRDGTNWSDKTDAIALGNYINSPLKGRVLPGDLMYKKGEDGVGGSHIGMIIGIDDKYFYVAESTGTQMTTSSNVQIGRAGVVVSKVCKNRSNCSDDNRGFSTILLMDGVYPSTGYITYMWES